MALSDDVKLIEDRNRVYHAALWQIRATIAVNIERLNGNDHELAKYADLVTARALDLKALLKEPTHD